MSRSLSIKGYIEYTTSAGDTFDAMALAAYNDEMQANIIMDANPDYIDVLIFEGGVKLQIPVIETVETPETLAPWRR